MFSLKSSFNTFFIAIATLAVASCVPTATEKKATCGTNQAFDNVSRSCYSIEQTRRVPVGTAASATTSEETPKTIILSYTDANLDQAISCEVSSVSSNIQAVSPLVISTSATVNNSALATQATSVFDKANALVSVIPASAELTSAIANRTLALAALNKMKLSNYYPTITGQLSVFQTYVETILSLAAAHLTVPSVVTGIAQVNAELTKLTPMKTQVNNYCQCSAGVCSTTIVPKLYKNGTAGFSYTVTDKDGASAVKPVSVTITSMATSYAHLKPVVQSSYLSPASLPSGIYAAGYFNESDTSTGIAYDVNLGTTGDIYSTPLSSMRYYFSGSKNASNKGITAKGLVSNCMDLSGSSGLSDTSCSYTPNDGNDNVTLVAPLPIQASKLVDDITYTAKSEGTYGNSITVQYFNLQSDNTTTDSLVTIAAKFGMVDSTESFVRVNGSAIKIFINPNYTSSSDILALVNAHPQASKLVVASGGSPTQFPIPSVITPIPQTLTGGTNGYDTFSYYVNNTLTNSGNIASAMITILEANDKPMVPKTYNSLFSQTETYLEEEFAKTINIGFTDVDGTAPTITMIVDTLPTCSTGLTNLSSLTASPNFSAPVLNGAVTCTAAGVCSAPVSIIPGTNFSGNACLYYTVTDAGGLTSGVQTVNLVVTNINDIPELSLNALPSAVALGAAQVNEDLAAGYNSYTDIFAGAGGGQWENTQLLTVTATSSNTALVPSTACTNYTPVTVAPAAAPTAVGQKQFDTVTMRCYISTGTSTVADWKLMPSLTVFPACAYDVYGQGSPVSVVTPSAANKRYLDTTNNKCYKSASTSSSSWAQEATLSNYKVSYIPEADKSGSTVITVTVKDNGGVLNSGADTKTDVLNLTVNFIDDAPVFISTITSIHTNEGGAIQSGAFTVDEDFGSTVDEDSQGITISNITTDNAGVLPVSAISIFYDLNDNGVEDSGEVRSVGQVLEASSGDNAKAHSFYLKLDPVDGVSGNANIQLTINDGLTPVTTNFSFIVHQVAALHGGWTNISSVGIKTDKNGAPVSIAELQCNYNKLTDSKKCGSGTAACTGVTSPNSTILPDAADVIFWDSAAQRCYRSTGTTVFSWVEMNTSCPITRETGVCSGNNCITSAAAQNLVTPDKVGQYSFNTTTNACYVSSGTTTADWQVYVPAKVTLSWKPFTMVGSTTDTGVTVPAQISGYNVYRRERNADYNFKGGHLKNATSTTVFTIPNATTRTFTDTTAIAGKLYYYVVRPVDNSIRNFPTYTPDTYSEVRVVAAPANYSFVHRWMINQEMCNGMNITNTTSPHRIDQTNNFRCEYSGPGHINISGTNYYDYGKDLLVDTQEAGCAYAVAPKCTANGCVGIGAPAPSLTANVVANDLYYDRSAGKCYSYSAGWTEVQAGGTAAAIMSKSNTALNAPLTNVTKTRAVALCSARTVPALTYNTAGVSTAWSLSSPVSLPIKKDYMAYASQKTDVTDPEITEMEQGFSLNIQSRCNGSSASGLDTAFTDSAIPSTSFIYSLPGTFSSGIRSLYTGSIPWGSSKGTEACVSRYGIQDLYGNVAEWVDDGMTCHASNKTCTTINGGSFTGTDFGTSYAFDYITGPYAEGGDGAADGTDDSYLTQWTFADELFGAGKFNYVLGLPILDSINTATYSAYMDWILDIGPSNGITTNKLHEDGIIVNATSVTANKAFAVGGSYLSGNRAGRFSSELINDTVASRPDVGFRCIVPVIPGDYQADTFYSYPN